MQRATFFIFILLSINCFAQLPDTDIWLLDIRSEKDSIIISNPVNITNRKGYDNQTSFSPDGKYILFTSMQDEKQTDIYKYELASKTISQFTNTSTSEYSPMITPDGKNVSVVMVEPDSAQRLWNFPLTGGAPSLIMKDVDSVGYYCWYFGDRFVISTITEPATLKLTRKKEKNSKLIARDVGRCIKNKSLIFFTQKTTDNRYKLYDFNFPGWHVGDHNTIIDSEDFDLLGNWIIFGKGSTLFKTLLSENKSEIITDLSFINISNITRIAISPDGKRMAIVAETKN